MSKPANYDLTIYRGDTQQWRFVLWADLAKTVPIDLTDVAVKAEVRDRPSGTKGVALDCTVTLPNIVDCVLTAAASQNNPMGHNGVWDMQLTYPVDTVSTVMAGKVVILRDVTDSGPLAVAA